MSQANLAVAYVEQARVTGLASYYENHDDAASRSFDIEADENFIALAGRASIKSAKHDFAKALASADEALAINPFDVGSLAIHVDTLTEFGRYAEQMRALRWPTVADRVRRSRRATPALTKSV